MKKITRFLLALIIFSLFSISYLVTSASAQGNNSGCAENEKMFGAGTAAAY
jgi:hypothetical protein